MVQAFAFGAFLLVPERRLILEHNCPVTLGNKVFDLLVALVEHRDRDMSREQLKSIVWPSRRVIADHNLSVALSTLRRALGDRAGSAGYIATVPGRGYRFVTPVTVCSDDGTPVPVFREPTKPVSNLPAAVSPLIGRAADVEAIRQALWFGRLVTVVGTGGIGKTRLALEVAETIAAEFPGGSWLVDLACLAPGDAIADAIASLIEVRPKRDALGNVVQALRHKKTLLIFDNCEHLLDESAAIAAAILERAPETCILATSREPLRLPVERTYRLHALETPDADATLTAAEALHYPAIELLVARISAALGHFEFTDNQVSGIAQISRRLDGIPLALEIVASQFHLMNAKEILRQLDARILLLMKGRRTAVPRQFTLKASIEWSYDLLPPAARSLLRRLAIFPGTWVLDAACHVAADGDLSASKIQELQRLLVEKSLVMVTRDDAEPRYRLFETTKQYLTVFGGEDRGLCSRLAEWCALRLRVAEIERENIADSHWIRRYGPEIVNLRLALTWAFSADGDRQLGMEILAYSVGMWSVLGLYDEEERWLSIANESIEQASADVAARLNYMRLRRQALDDGTKWDEARGAMALARVGKDEHALSRMLDVAVTAAISAGDLPAAQSLLAEADQVLAAAPLRRRTRARWHMNAARIALSLGNACVAEAHLEEAIAIGEQIGAAKIVASASHELLYRRTELDRGIRVFQQMLGDIEGALGQRSLHAHVLGLLSGYQLLKGDAAAALRSAQQSLANWRCIGHRPAYLKILDRCVGILAALGQVDAAARLLGYCDAWYRRSATPRRPIFELIRQGAMVRLTASLSPEERTLSMALGASLSEDQVVAELIAFEPSAIELLQCREVAIGDGDRLVFPSPIVASGMPRVFSIDRTIARETLTQR